MRYNVRDPSRLSFQLKNVIRGNLLHVEFENQLIKAWPEMYVTYVLCHIKYLRRCHLPTIKPQKCYRLFPSFMNQNSFL